MNELTLHPNVYATGRSKGLVNILERVWVHDHTPGDGTLFVVSGFGNYNGGVRFFETFREHKERGVNLVAVFAGIRRQNQKSKKVVREKIGRWARVQFV